VAQKIISYYNTKYYHFPISRKDFKIWFLYYIKNRLFFIT